MNLDLTFLIKSLKRRFPDRSALEIHNAIETVLEEMRPSRDRAVLQRKVTHFLSVPGKSSPSGDSASGVDEDR